MLVYNEKEQVEQKEIENAEFMEKKKGHWQEKGYGQGLYGKKLVPLKRVQICPGIKIVSLGKIPLVKGKGLLCS